GLLQRKCACGGTPDPTGECEACRKKRLQRKAVQHSTLTSQPSEAPPIVHEVLRSPGQPLDPQTRAFMEPSFGHDFNCVPVLATDARSLSVNNAPASVFSGSLSGIFINGPDKPAPVPSAPGPAPKQPAPGNKAPPACPTDIKVAHTESVVDKDFGK